MDALILLGSFALLCALGVPVAYALGLSSRSTRAAATPGSTSRSKR